MQRVAFQLFLLLINHFFQAKNAAGISLRSHELFLMVFVTRYLDLFTTFYSLYNSFMKILYIVVTASIVYMIRYQPPICTTYDKVSGMVGSGFRLMF